MTRCPRGFAPRMPRAEPIHGRSRLTGTEQHAAAANTSATSPRVQPFAYMFRLLLRRNQSLGPYFLAVLVR